MSGSVWDALPDVREWLGDSQGLAGMVSRPYRMSGSGRRPTRMSEIGREALPDVMEWLKDPPRCRRPSEI